MPKANRGSSRRPTSKKRMQKRRFNRLFKVLKIAIRIVKAILYILSIWGSFEDDSSPLFA
jgi:hypothetical protein